MCYFKWAFQSYSYNIYNKKNDNFALIKKTVSNMHNLLIKCNFNILKIKIPMKI